MSFNATGEIVTMAHANGLLALRVPGAELPSDEYARIQLLTFESYDALAYDAVNRQFKDGWAALSYGSSLKDFPLCADFAKILVGLVCLAGAVLGLGVRAYFFRLHYTKLDGSRHAINGALCVDGTVKFLEPQTMEWMDRPKDLKKYDRVRL